MAAAKVGIHDPDKRHSTLRRNVNDLFMRDGQVEEAKLLSVIGKGLCCWLIVAHTDVVLQTENTLITLLLFLIMPDLLKKWLSMRFGATEDKKG
jgi:hypothetical protein